MDLGDFNKKIRELEKRATELKTTIAIHENSQTISNIQTTFDTLRKYDIMLDEEDAIKLDGIYQKEVKKAKEIKEMKDELEELNIFFNCLRKFDLYNKEN